jgi:hypothetical protein
MARKAKMPAESANAAAPAADTLPPDQTVPSADASQPAGEQRDSQGRYLKNNAGGPGNPHARYCARMLEMFRNSITDEEMYGLCRVLFERAITGDMAALKMIWQYKLGKPLPAPNPDMIDRDEWDHFQKDAMTLDEMRHVLGQLPSRIVNSIVSSALPSITSAISHTLAQQLLQGLPAEYLANQSNGPAPNSLAPHPSALAPDSPPGSNGVLPAQSSGETPSPATRPTPLATHSHPISNGDLPELDQDGLPVRTFPPAPPATQSPPVSNGVSAAQPGGEASASSSRAPRRSPPASPASLSTRHAPLATPLPATHSLPVSNGKSKAGAKGKKGRKAVGKQWLDPIARKCKTPAQRRQQRVSA